MKRIGFIGLGNMGSRMCQRLLDASYPCMVFDLNQDAVTTLIAQGATAATTITDLKDAEVIFTMLQTGDQVAAVLEPLFITARKGTYFVDCSSIDVVQARALHAKAVEHGHYFLDAPVSGGILGAAAGTLTIMLGGDPEHIATLKPLLEVIAKNIIHAGPAGCGQVAKICNNMVLGISMIAVSEAFNLAKDQGLTADKFFQIAGTASGQCWALTSYCPEPGILENVPSTKDYQPGFTAEMMKKDLNLAQNAAQQSSTNTPLGKMALELYQSMLDSGQGQLDFSAIIRKLAE